MTKQMNLFDLVGWFWPGLKQFIGWWCGDLEILSNLALVWCMSCFFFVLMMVPKNPTNNNKLPYLFPHVLNASTSIILLPTYSELSWSFMSLHPQLTSKWATFSFQAGGWMSRALALHHPGVQVIGTCLGTYVVFNIVDVNRTCCFVASLWSTFLF